MKRSLLIVVGAGSDVAQRTIPGLSAFDDFVGFSTQSGEIRFAGSSQKLHNYSQGSPIDSQIDRYLPSKSDVSHLGFISLTGLKDDSLLIRSSESNLENLFEVNLLIPTVFSRAILARYLGVRSNFVFVSSSGALAGAAGVVGYSASKHGLLGLSRGIAVEYGRLGVVSNCLALGLLDLGMGKSLDEKQRTEFLQRTTTRRAVREESVTMSLDFLLRTEDVTGTTLYCDGGYH